MEKIVITEEQMKNAVSYAPALAKAEFVEYCRRRCLDKSLINLGYGENDAMPDMYIENTFAKSRYLMTALCVFYLGIPRSHLELENGDDWMMTVAEYDRYAMSHVVNQIERMKSNAALRDKAFDILRDYRDLEKRLNTAIYNTMTMMNDPTNRLFQKLAFDMSPEVLEEQRKELERLQQEMEDFKKSKEGKG